MDNQSPITNYQSRLNHLKRVLLKYLDEHGRSHLPWRKKHVTPYQVWVSEVMLQQTQVSRVVPYYEAFIKRFPSVQDLAKASWRTFLPHYRGLGYYLRGRNMLEAAKVVVRDRGGRFPKDLKQLKKLPGIGEYTARAILGFGYQLPYLAPDTNVKKVLARYLHGSKHAVVDINEVEPRLKASLPVLNAAIMDFSNDICLKDPRCLACPLAGHCQYARTKGRNELSTIGKRSDFPAKQASVLLWLHKDHRKYYSSHADRCEPFRLSPECNTRAKIKRHFKQEYGLELAVRPPHRKTFLRDRPVMFVNAQILLGRHEFAVFDRQDARRYDDETQSR